MNGAPEMTDMHDGEKRNSEQCRGVDDEKENSKRDKLDTITISRESPIECRNLRIYGICFNGILRRFGCVADVSCLTHPHESIAKCQIISNSISIQVVFLPVD